MKAYVLILGAMLLLVACNSNAPESSENEFVDSEGVDWRDAEFRDIRTGETFTIKDFEGKTVFVESFAVWCPTCTKQQQENKKFHPDGVVHVSLATDPNEDEELVLDHINKFGFDWNYAISSSENTQLLVEEFGTTIINAPSVPIIMVCPEGDSRLLGIRGVKFAEDLEKEMAQGC